MKLEELLTRCLLKLDELDRKDENINAQRRTLIDFTNELADYLESKTNSSNDSTKQQQQRNNKRHRNSNNNHQNNNLAEMNTSYFDESRKCLIISQNDMDSIFKCVICDSQIKLIDYFSHKLSCEFE